MTLEETWNSAKPEEQVNIILNHVFPMIPVSALRKIWQDMDTNTSDAIEYYTALGAKALYDKKMQIYYGLSKKG